MDIFEGKNKRYCKRLTKFGRNIVLRIKPRAAMFVVRSANLSLARYLTNPRVIAWLPALKGPLEPRLLTEILLFWASLSQSCGVQNAKPIAFWHSNENRSKRGKTKKDYTGWDFSPRPLGRINRVFLKENLWKVGFAGTKRSRTVITRRL